MAPISLLYFYIAITWASSPLFDIKVCEWWNNNKKREVYSGKEPSKKNTNKFFVNFIIFLTCVSVCFCVCMCVYGMWVFQIHKESRDWICFVFYRNGICIIMISFQWKITRKSNVIISRKKNYFLSLSFSLSFAFMFFIWLWNIIRNLFVWVCEFEWRKGVHKMYWEVVDVCKLFWLK